ncbi:hypothetical protein L1987_56702 [Smallanthus sonchifolius]|uniref:Uncharacterized protein n=1 Tax=Smallanthus sonchifolius TaxID=185202 RepID=A0ACB9ECX4_9ASTR|nr:hypothetical protein L1987_56702 [Smallanthus sonchifolius]
MVLQHTYLLLAVSTLDPLSDQHHLSWQAAFFFITTWICFLIGEVLLLIGVSVESGHLSTPRPTCFIAREGLFSSAGVLGITTVFLASALSIGLLMQEFHYSSSPAAAPTSFMAAVDTETPIVTHHDPGLLGYLRAFDNII